MGPDASVMFTAAVAAHLLGDFLFQSDREVRAKQAGNLAAYLRHALVHAALVYALCGVWKLWILPLIVLLTHPLVDAVKAAFSRVFGREERGLSPRAALFALLADQAVHLAILYGTVVALGTVHPPPTSFLTTTFGSVWTAVLVLVSGAVATVYAGGIVVGIIVEPFLRELRPPLPPNEVQRQRRGFRRGGLFIGQLERTLIYLFILIEQPGAVGFLIAAKSIFRFGELKDHENRMEAEYITIGTMLSFSWGVLVAWLTKHALSLL